MLAVGVIKINGDIGGRVGFGTDHNASGVFDFDPGCADLRVALNFEPAFYMYRSVTEI